MRAIIERWSVNTTGPALHTRTEHKDGKGNLKSVTFDSMNEINLTLRVTGEDSKEFVNQIARLKPGSLIKSIAIATADDRLGAVISGKTTKGRYYEFE